MLLLPSQPTAMTGQAKSIKSTAADIPHHMRSHEARRVITSYKQLPPAAAAHLLQCAEPLLQLADLVQRVLRVHAKLHSSSRALCEAAGGAKLHGNLQQRQQQKCQQYWQQARHSCGTSV